MSLRAWAFWRLKQMRRSAWAEANGITAEELEGWKLFASKYNALRHSFISYRVAQVQDVAKVSLEAVKAAREKSAAAA